MMKQINDKNLIGKTIKEFHCTKGSYDLVIVFQDNTFTVISSYPEEGDKSFLYNDILDVAFILDNEDLLLSMKIINEEDIKTIHKLIKEKIED